MPKLRPVALTSLALAYAGLAVALFLPNASLVPVYALIPAVVIGIYLTGEGAVALLIGGFTILLGVFCMTRVEDRQVAFILALMGAQLAALALAHVHGQGLRRRRQAEQMEEDELSREARVLKQEVAFYEGRAAELSARSAQRRRLSTAARELGAVLDPQAIQARLQAIAGELFPARPVKISYGQDADAIDSFISQRRQPVLVPGEMFRGDPLMAVPILVQRQAAAVLRVGGAAGQPFSRDDLRLLDILGGLASMALENAMLLQQVQETALRDGLTGLLTHRAFQDHLQAAVLEASRYNQPLSVILCDVDHFKAVNDSLGHQAGDLVLQGFAHVLDRNVRNVDVVARYGGEEFIVLLLQTGHAQALEMAERIRLDLAAQEFDAPGRPLSITSSFGVATFPEDATSGQQLVRQADQRLYKAKKAGRNRVQGR